jgi:rare lipoprotein A
MRATNVTIGTSLLAVPASAAAITGVAAAAGFPGTAPGADQSHPIRADLTPRQVVYGGRVEAHGAAPATDSGRTVALQLAGTPTTGYKTVASARIGRGGSFSLSARLKHSGYVRVAEAPTAGGATAAAQAVSSSRRVIVRPDLQVAHPSVQTLGGRSVAVRGKLLPRLSGRPIELQRRSHHAWSHLASTRTGVQGGFRLSFVTHAIGRQQLRVVFRGDSTDPGAVRRAELTVFRETVASWYNDGGATACGFHAGYGVANLGLPCGSKVTFRYRGRTVHAVVDDRGPYVGGREWDLNQNTASALGFGGVGSVWSTR